MGKMWRWWWMGAAVSGSRVLGRMKRVSGGWSDGCWRLRKNGVAREVKGEGGGGGAEEWGGGEGFEGCEVGGSEGGGGRDGGGRAASSGVGVVAEDGFC